MTRALAIFRKDVRHLWLEALIFPAVLAFAAFTDAVDVDYKLETTLVAACWYTIVRVIHQEPLPGDRQYWLTRPYTWRDLLAAKALFLVLFLILPFAIFHAATWMAFGIAPLQHLRTLFWKEAFFTALYVVPAAALAAITRNMAHTILAGLLVGLGWIVSVELLHPWDVGNLDRQHVTALAGVLLVFGAAVLLIQYWRRPTGLMRGLAAVALACALWGRPPHALSARTTQPAPRISLDTSAPAQLDTRRFDRISVPIRIEGIPPGLDLFVSSVGASANGVYPNHTVMTANSLILEFNYGPQPDLASGFADVRGNAEITLFRDYQATPLAPQGRTVIPRFGACSIRPDADGKPNAICYSPHPRLALFVQSRGWNKNWVVPRGFVNDPLPASRFFEPLERFHSQLSAENPGDFYDGRIVALEPVSYLSLNFYFTGVPLRRDW